MRAYFSQTKQRLALLLLVLAAVAALAISQAWRVPLVREVPTAGSEAASCDGTQLAGGARTPLWSSTQRGLGRNGLLVGIGGTGQPDMFKLQSVNPESAQVADLGPELSGIPTELAVSPDGHWALVSSNGTGPVAMPPDTLRLVSLQDGRVERTTPFDYMSLAGLAWSPDSTAFVIATSSQLFLGSVETANLVKLTDAQRSFALPIAWSPDGRWISYAEETPSLNIVETSITVIHPDGSGQQRLTGSGRGSIAWFPDGSELVVGNGPGASIVRPDGTDLRQLLFAQPGIVSFDGPVWSPTGRYLAFKSSGRSSEELSTCVMAADGTLRQRDACSGTWYGASGVVWSPDEAWLVVPTTRDCGESGGLRLVSASGNEPGRGLPSLSYVTWLIAP